MNTLWSEGRPLTKTEVINLSTERSWRDCSAHLLLNGLLRKGAVKESGFVKCGKTYGRLYEANISCADYYISHVFGGSGRGILPTLVKELVRSADRNEEWLLELRDIIDKRLLG